MVLSSVDASADSHCSINVESVLRLRPLAKKEAEDAVVLEQVQNVIRDAPATVVLNPIHAGTMASPAAGGARGRSESDGTANCAPTEFHFNHVLSDSTSQDKIYYTLGLPIATAAMSSLKPGTRRGQNGPKSHLLVCMGVAGSGKTYTCLGGASISKRRASQDGLVPRLVDSLFSQSKHHTSSGNDSRSFAVNISIAQVTHQKGSDPHACVIHDLLSTGASEKPKEKKKVAQKRNLTVRGMAAKFERAIGSPIRSPMKSSTTELNQLDIDNIELSMEACTDVTQAREVLQKGLTNSAKAANGQNHHLLITLQPVSNGHQLGDKIAILDMAGLEKGRKSQSRGKDSVANKNQEASAAVLHCLRTMIHNTNVRNGKADSIDMADDAISEISSVSQEKNTLQRQLKPVPFRQHKVTMLLQPLFTESASSKITLMLAAYPGHADYYEKRILLQDMELLCGSALIGSHGRASTGLNRLDSCSVVSSESRSTVGRTSTMDDDEASVGQGSERSFRERSNKYRSTSPQLQSQLLSGSLHEADQNVVPQPPAYAPTFPESRTVSHAKPTPTAPPLEESDQPAPRLQGTRTSGSRKALRNPDYVSDFPGVHLPAKKQLSDPVAERQRVTSTYTSSNVGGRNASVPPTEPESAIADRDLTKRRPALNNETSRQKEFAEELKSTRQPLGRSSLENGTESFENGPSSGTKKKASRYNTQKSEASQGRESPCAFEAVSVPKPKNSSSAVRHHSSDSSGEREDVAGSNSRDSCGATYEPRSSRETNYARNFSDQHSRLSGGEQRSSSPTSGGFTMSQRDQEENQKKMALEAEKRIQELEKKMKDLQQAKESYEKKCSDLEGENEKLKLSVKEAVVKAQVKWTKQDEEQFMRSREARLEDQTLVKKPLRSHMDKVNHIYDIKNQWCKTDKPHFDLSLPSHFQRAPDLDVRDREWESREAEAILGKERYAAPKAEEKKEYQPSPQTKRKNRKQSMKAKEPSPFLALKKLL